MGWTVSVRSARLPVARLTVKPTRTGWLARGKASQEQSKLGLWDLVHGNGAWDKAGCPEYQVHHRNDEQRQRDRLPCGRKLGGVRMRRQCIKGIKEHGLDWFHLNYKLETATDHGVIHMHKVKVKSLHTKIESLELENESLKTYGPGGEAAWLKRKVEAAKLFAEWDYLDHLSQPSQSDRTVAA
jgi:hypothetical protein